MNAAKLLEHTMQQRNASILTWRSVPKSLFCSYLNYFESGDWNFQISGITIKQWDHSPHFSRNILGRFYSLTALNFLSVRLPGHSRDCLAPSGNWMLDANQPWVPAQTNPGSQPAKEKGIRQAEAQAAFSRRDCLAPWQPLKIYGQMQTIFYTQKHFVWSGGPNW